MLDEGLDPQLLVAALAPFGLRDRAAHRPDAADDAPLLTVGERARCLHVEHRLDARLGLLRMLTPRPARARGSQLDLGLRQRHRTGHADHLLSKAQRPVSARATAARAIESRRMA